MCDYVPPGDTVQKGYFEVKEAKPDHPIVRREVAPVEGEVRGSHNIQADQVVPPLVNVAAAATEAAIPANSNPTNAPNSFLTFKISLR